METPIPAADIIRRKIEDHVAKKDLRAAVVQCEELEILTARTPSAEQDERWAKVHLALLLALDDVNNGRHLWRRLPASAKEEGGELAALWGVGKCIWKRDVQGAQGALRGREWSANIAPFVALVGDRVWEKQLSIISKAYTALPLERVAIMLGCGVADAEKACLKEGWTVEVGEGGDGEVKGEGAGGEKIVTPKTRPSTETIPVMRPDLLQKMARHISFLERQNQG